MHNIEHEELEDILYALGNEWLPDELRLLIGKTIIKLPEKVREFALHNCTYVEFYRGLDGQVIPAWVLKHLARQRYTAKNHYLIMLGEHIANRKDGEFTVAHEIAHAYRGKIKHIMVADHLEEEEADKLAASWGFKIPKHRYKIHAAHRAAVQREEDDAMAAAARRRQ